MSQTLHVYTTDSNGVTYADPTQPDYQVRFKNSRSRKSISGVAVENHITEIIMTQDVNAQLCGATCASPEAVSVRLRVSGSVPAMDEIKKMISDLAAQVDTWTGENVLIGFRPSTAPVRDVE